MARGVNPFCFGIPDMRFPCVSSTFGIVFRWPLLAMLAVAMLAGCASTPRQPAPDIRLVPWLSANGKYGYVDDSGKLRIPAQYDDAHPFYHGLAAASQDKKWGYIDTVGRWVVSPIYDKAYDFNPAGQGEVLSISDAFNLGSGLLPIYLTDKRVYYRVYDANGLLVKRGKIQDAKDTSDYDVRAAVLKVGKPAESSPKAARWTTGVPGKSDNPSRDARWGLKAADGHWVVSPRYQREPRFRDGLARVERACRAFYIDARGHEYAANTQDWPKPPVISCARTEFYQCAQCQSYYTSW